MTVVITDDTSRAAIEEIIVRVLRCMRRLPAIKSYQDAGHARLDALLEDWAAAKLREQLAAGVYEVPD